MCSKQRRFRAKALTGSFAIASQRIRGRKIHMTQAESQVAHPCTLQKLSICRPTKPRSWTSSGWR